MINSFIIWIYVTSTFYYCFWSWKLFMDLVVNLLISRWQLGEEEILSRQRDPTRYTSLSFLQVLGHGGVQEIPRAMGNPHAQAANKPADASSSATKDFGKAVFGGHLTAHMGRRFGGSAVVCIPGRTENQSQAHFLSSAISASKLAMATSTLQWPQASPGQMRLVWCLTRHRSTVHISSANGQHYHQLNAVLYPSLVVARRLRRFSGLCVFFPIVIDSK